MKYSKIKKRKKKEINIIGELLIPSLALAFCEFFIIKQNSLYFYIPIIFTILFSLYTFFVKRKKKNIYLNSGIQEVDRMTGEEFELFLKAHFEENGYRVDTTPGSNDYGADLILHKNGEIIALQAKRYKNKVGIKAVQEISSSLAYYKASSGMVVTNSHFTVNAEKLALANNVTLIDREGLMNIMCDKKRKKNRIA